MKRVFETNFHRKPGVRAAQGGKRICRWSAAVLVLLVPGCLSVRAQVDTGTISGIVTDKSGAVVPDTDVTVVHEDTGTRFHYLTNTAGYYSATALRPGRYQVSVARQGFQILRRTGIELRVQDRLEINFEIQVGEVTSDVAVTAGSTILEGETSSLGQVVESKTITDLPLNGRNFMLLATLGAGTLPSFRGAERNTFVSNGARPIQNTYLLDGVDNKNRIIGFDGSSAQIIQPVIDAIEEFKVQTSTFSAEFGQSAGGVVNVSLKSGGNQLHGSLFEFLRNSQMDATPYFQPPGGKPQFIQNQYGATLGGPLRKNRTFFFGAWQGSREINAAPQVGTVPTLEAREGIIRQTPIYDPATTRRNPNGSGYVRSVFPENTVPRSRWDPVAAKLAPLYPLPNLSGPRNFFYNPKERTSADQVNARIDHEIRSRDHLFGRFSTDLANNLVAPPLPPPTNDFMTIQAQGRSLAVGETHTLSSEKLNEFRFGYIYTYHQQDTPPPRRFAEYGILGAPENPKIHGLPNFIIGSLNNLGTAPPGGSGIGAAGTGNTPSEKSGTIFQFRDNFSWVHRRHTIKLGGDVQQVNMSVYTTNEARPDIVFNGAYTQNPQARSGSGNAYADFLLGLAAAAGITTQNLNHLRQRVFAGYIQDDWKVSAHLTLNLGLRYELQTPVMETANLQANFILEQGPCYRQLVLAKDSGRCGLGPALVGLDTNNFAPRAGFAWQPGARTVVRGGFGVFYGRDENLGIQRRLANNPPFAVQAALLGDQITPNFQLASGFPPGTLDPAQAVSPQVYYYPKDFPLPYVLQWNLNVERQLPGQLLVQVAYTGSGSHKLYYVNNLNQPPPGTGPIDARRPLQGYGAIYTYAPLINSTYHALLAKVERRFSRGLSLLASYTYGHALDGGKSNNDAGDVLAQNPRDLRAEHSSSNFDIRQRFVVSGVWELPRSAGRIVRGWQVSGIAAAQTGLPFTPVLSFDPTNTGTTARPDRLADGSLPTDQRNASHWFNTSAFRAPQGISFGNSGRDILRAPGVYNLDLSLARTFAFTERWRLQFRGEGFNLFNHPNLGVPNAVIGDQRAGIISNVITPERQIQFALKLFF